MVETSKIGHSLARWMLEQAEDEDNGMLRAGHAFELQSFAFEQADQDLAYRRQCGGSRCRILLG